MDDDQILDKGGTQDDINSYAHDNGACGAILGGTCDYCGKTDTTPTQDELNPEILAQKFHEYYEQLAPRHSYETRKTSAVLWKDVPANNKGLMIHVAEYIIKDFEAYKDNAVGELLDSITESGAMSHIQGEHWVAQIEAEHKNLKSEEK